MAPLLAHSANSHEISSSANIEHNFSIRQKTHTHKEREREREREREKSDRATRSWLPVPGTTYWPCLGWVRPSSFRYKVLFPIPAGPFLGKREPLSSAQFRIMIRGSYMQWNHSHFEASARSLVPTPSQEEGILWFMASNMKPFLSI